MRSLIICSAILCFVTMPLFRGAGAATISTSEPGTTIVDDDVGDARLVACTPQQPRRPCTVAASALNEAPGWTDITHAEIRQIRSDAVELSMTMKATIPTTPDVALLIYYWQFQDGCAVPTPTDKSGINVVWNGRRWNAHWFVVKSCSPREVVAGDPVRASFDGRTVHVSVRLADLVTRGGAPLEWFAATRLLEFKHPVFARTLPVDTAPNVVSLDPARPGEPLHPQQAATWIPR